MDKLNDIKLEDGSYLLGDTVYDRNGEIFDVIEKIPDTEKFEIWNEEIKRSNEKLKYN